MLKNRLFHSLSYNFENELGRGYEIVMLDLHQSQHGDYPDRSPVQSTKETYEALISCSILKMLQPSISCFL